MGWVGLNFYGWRGVFFVPADLRRGAGRPLVVAGCALCVGGPGAGVASTAHADTADQCIAAAEQSQPLRHDGKLLAGRRLLIACSRSECPSVVRTDCTKWLADLDALMPSGVGLSVDSVGGSVLGVLVAA